MKINGCFLVLATKSYLDLILECENLEFYKIRLVYSTSYMHVGRSPLMKVKGLDGGRHWTTCFCPTAKLT